MEIHRDAGVRTVAAIVAGLAVLSLFIWLVAARRDEPKRPSADTGGVLRPEQDEHAADVVELSPEAFASAGIAVEIVSESALGTSLQATGSVEPNAEQTQQVTPLVSGRIESVSAAVGDSVRAGAPLAIVSSPEVAEMQGKLREAETRRRLAERNVKRVEQAENRVAVLAAKARLAEAEATLRSTRRLTEFGATAGRDLTAAETVYATAKAEYDYQSNIALNREVQEAQAELETAMTEIDHLRQSLKAFGAVEGGGGNISHVTLRAPNAGRVTERFVNVGAGVQAGTPLFTIGNLSSVWVIARVPESQVGLLATGSTAEVRTSEPGTAVIAGRINYIDTSLDETTRTARVRVEVSNPGERLRVGMFVEVAFPGAGTTAARGCSVPAEAVQRIDDRSVVFVAIDGTTGRFEVRTVDVDAETGGTRRVTSGVRAGERVVTKGSFALKGQLLKGELGGHDH